MPALSTPSTWKVLSGKMISFVREVKYTGILQEGRIKLQDNELREQRKASDDCVEAARIG